MAADKSSPRATTRKLKKTGARRLLSMKLVVSLVTLTVVTTTILGVFSVTEKNTRQAMIQAMETRLLIQARHLALLSTDALLSDYPELILCPIVREMLQEENGLAVAVVLDYTGKIQGHPDVRRLGEPYSVLDRFTPMPSTTELRDQETLLSNEKMFAARVPAQHINGLIVGSVIVAEDRDHVSNMLAENRHQVSMLAAGLLAAAALVTLLMVHRLLAPLDALRAGLARIGSGKLDSPIVLKSRTEFGLLADTINTMASQLETSQAEARAKEQEIIATQSEVIHTLGEVVESRSHETGNHIDRVAEGAAQLAVLAELPLEECELLLLAAPMHDVGKIGVPDAILNKPGKLTDEEFATMKSHSHLGYQILSQSNRPILKAAAIVAHEHHERWDGKGYPRGLAGEDIHIYGRIVAIVDVFDALTSDRCYRAAMPLEKALAIMAEGRGTQFDPTLLDLFMDNLDCFQEFMESQYAGGRKTLESTREEPIPV